MSTVLDSRVIRIVLWLLAQDGARSTADLAADLGLSQRVVRYRLGVVEKFLVAEGAMLKRQRGSGLSVEAPREVRERIRQELSDRSEAPRVNTPEERQHLLSAALLWAAPNTVSLDVLHLELQVSKASARRDLSLAEPWFDRNELPVVRKPGVGVVLVGPERRIRQVTVQHLLEVVPNQVLLEQLAETGERSALAEVRIPAGLREHLLELPLQEAASIVRNSALGNGLAAGNTEVVMALYVAVSLARIQRGRMAKLAAGLQRSLLEHPVGESATEIIDAMSRYLGTVMAPGEVACVTEYLLGLNALGSSVSGPLAVPDSVIVDILSLASDRLHSALADDQELRRGLSQHLERLAVRLRHGLPVHNPLLSEVVDRYPDVHRVALEIGKILEDAMGATIVSDEVGFITMYLSGAMERARLRPRRRALVVCPSGMATAWVLVSRIQAEFPELDLVEVLSERSYHQLDHGEFDLVISTVDLPQRSSPVVVVTPLLSAGDRDRVSEQL